MRGLILFTLPALALAAVASLDPRQSSRRIRVVGAKRLGGNGCPPGWFLFKPNEEDPNATPAGTLAFGQYVASVGPQDPSANREKTCEFEVTFEFPLGCTSGTILVQPRGDVTLQPGTQAVFTSQNDISPGTLGPNPPDIRFTEDRPGFVENYLIPVRENVLENQRNVTFTARTRIFVVQPGPIEESSFAVDSLDLSVLGATTC
ncbi:hypothetical protein QBC37DRAFT_449326 [Rhypophila decipiens]|uniref:Ubiquitin 3 binding protein But2 C-terminal domain-containing protein n=1 Tax=Rhypophila decipiens TaxID=261697 RepID=A0AAN6Y0G5_9PEZI|nr:hypothetical protein QBC37DRAFT_449326 [Rhypophila decipiens]